MADVMTLDERLLLLQDKVIDHLLEQIESGEAPPSLVSAAIRLLNDHGVSTAVNEDSEITKVAQAIMEREMGQEGHMDLDDVLNGMITHSPREL